MKALMGFNGCVFFLIVTLILPGCVSQKGFSRSFPKRLTSAQSTWQLRYGAFLDAVQAKQSTAGQVVPPLNQSELQVILNRLAYSSPLRGYPLRVVIKADNKVNAFTDGSQNIYVTTGLLQMFDRRTDVIASVLAHELGHVLADHLADKKPRGGILRFFSYFTPALGLLPYGGFYSGAAGTALREGAKIQDFAYNRRQETEADVIGTFLACRAGFDSMGLSDFLEVIRSSGYGAPATVVIPMSLQAVPQSALVTILSTSPLYRIHPPSESRRKIVNLARQRCFGSLPSTQLRKQSPWLEDLIQTMEARSPR